jgi:hypothetical protein
LTATSRPRRKNEPTEPFSARYTTLPILHPRVGSSSFREFAEPLEDQREEAEVVSAPPETAATATGVSRLDQMREDSASVRRDRNLEASLTAESLEFRTCL